MDKTLEISTHISTPLKLAALFGVIVLLLSLKIISRSPAKAHSPGVLKFTLLGVFSLAFCAMVLVYVMGLRQTDAKTQSALQDPTNLITTLSGNSTVIPPQPPSVAINTNIISSIETSNSTKQAAAPDPAETPSGRFTFNLVDCKKSRGYVTCKLELSANEIDRDIYLLVTQTGGIANRSLKGMTCLYDDQGNRYDAASVTVGNLRSPDTGQLRAHIINGTKTPVVFTFRTVGEKIQSISLLSIQGNDGQAFSVEFRKLSLSK